jgi:hypothetical protein
MQVCKAGAATLGAVVGGRSTIFLHAACHIQKTMRNDGHAAYHGQFFSSDSVCPLLDQKRDPQDRKIQGHVAYHVAGTPVLDDGVSNDIGARVKYLGGTDMRSRLPGLLRRLSVFYNLH